VILKGADGVVMMVQYVMHDADTKMR
jgi:hypothetical protein